MVFCLIFFALTAAVAFFHYTQGFFSATISAIFAVIAAAVALGYYQVVAGMIIGTGNFVEQADSLALVGLFAVCYIILRFLFDSLVPGNIRLPVLVDKIGAGVMGLFVGLLSVGVLALAADALPFGPTVGMYSRFAVTDKTPGPNGPQYMGKYGRMEDTTLYNVLVPDTIDGDVPEKQHLWLHQDDFAAAVAEKLSDGGSLASGQAFGQVHPDFVDELYGQRLGIQVGAQHTLVSTPASPTLKVAGVYTQPTLTQVDGEIPTLRRRDTPLPTTVQLDPDQMLLIVRAKLSGKITNDPDSNFRFSPGSVRLSLGHTTDQGVDYHDYHPIGTLDPSGVLVVNQPDDFLFAPSGSRTIDFVFIVNKDDAVRDTTKMPYHLNDGSLLQVKRDAYVDLSGMAVDYGPPPNPDKDSVLRKPEVAKIIANAHPAPLKLPEGATYEASAGPPAATGSTIGDTGLTFDGIAVSNKLFSPIDVQTHDASKQVQLADGVSGDYENRQWRQLTVTPTATLEELKSPGDELIDQFGVDSGQVLVVLHCHAPAENDVWGWTKSISNLSLADPTGMITFRCVGAWTQVQRGAQQYMAVSFNDQATGPALEFKQQTGRPTDVWLAFSVPTGNAIQQLHEGDKTVLDSLAFVAK